MKKTLTALLLIGTLYSYAQQDPYFTHFKDVMQVYNPAAAGKHSGEICLSGLTHHQWRDFDDQTQVRGAEGDPLYINTNPDIEDVAPVTYNLNVETIWKLLKKDSSWKLGTGLTIVDDKVSYSKGTTVMANINVKKELQGGFSEISAGFGVGMTQWGFDKPDFKARQQNDPKVPVSGGNQSKLDLNFGAMYKQKRLGPLKNFFSGISVTNVNGAKYIVPVSTAGGQTSLQRHFVPHYYTIAGADYPLNGNLVLEPAILGKYMPVASGSGTSYVPQFDLNVTALYASTFRGGIAYRQYGNADAASVLMGYIKGALEVGYAYDITLSNLQRVSNGTHEIIVKYCIPIVTKPPPPPIIRLTPRFL